MKIYAISDLHLSTVVDKPMNIFGSEWTNHFDAIRSDWLSKVKENDVCLLCGDFSWAMRTPEVLPDFDLLASLPGKKIIIRGNHDYWWNTIGQVRSLLPEGFFALQNDCLRIEDYLFFGTRGWTCPEAGKPFADDDNKIYKRELQRLELSVADMKKKAQEGDKKICLMHFPPFNSAFESDFIKILVECNTDAVVYGHLHGNDGRTQLIADKFGMRFYLTSCDLLCNKLVQIDI